MKIFISLLLFIGLTMMPLLSLGQSWSFDLRGLTNSTPISNRAIDPLNSFSATMSSPSGSPSNPIVDSLGNISFSLPSDTSVHCITITGLALRISGDSISSHGNLDDEDSIYFSSSFNTISDPSSYIVTNPGTTSTMYLKPTQNIDTYSWNMTFSQISVTVCAARRPSNLSSTNTSAPLRLGTWLIFIPVELIQFDATRIEASNEVLITWSTASELNSDFFTLEKSSDAINWEYFKNIPAAGNSSSIVEYSVVDYEMRASRTYYRLTQTDFDGKKVDLGISQVESINSDKSFSIFPNPATGQLTVHMDNEKRKQLSIVNLLGEELITKQISNDEDKIVDISDLRPGVYLINVGSTTRKLIVN